MECPALGAESWGSATSVQRLVSEAGHSGTRQRKARSLRLAVKKHDCVVTFCSRSVFLTDIEDEGVTESVVPVVATVDQELCIREDGAAVPAVAQKCKRLH